MQNNVPLCVDLDGTFLKTDTLYELFLRVIKQAPWKIIELPLLVLKGKQHLKKYLSEQINLDPSLLPCNEKFLAYLRSEHESGRRIILVTGCYEKTAKEIAAHYGLFDDVIASNESVNLTGKNKAAHLVEKFGDGGFDYAGNDSVDIPVWEKSRSRILVNSGVFITPGLTKKIKFTDVFDRRTFDIRSLIKTIRLHQWAKNSLIFVPALTAHALLGDSNTLLTLVFAFIAFGCCASFSYIVNDMLDLDADRKHHRKRYRPLASGSVSIVYGMLLAFLLLGLTVFISLKLSMAFSLLLLIYFISTNLYSFKLKAIPILDVSMLAGLYTLRVIAGAVAVNLDASFWLIAFSAFLFFSLAIVKRLSELLYLEKNSTEPVKARGYVAEDISTLQVLGGSAAMAAVLVLSLYINSESVRILYENPRHLWLLCPVLLIWLGRVWLITGRGQMHDDPVLFALKDRVSWLIFVVGAGVLISAKYF